MFRFKTFIVFLCFFIQAHIEQSGTCCRTVNISHQITFALTEAYNRPLSFIARYLPEKSPLMATTPTSTAVISMMPVQQKQQFRHFSMLCMATENIKYNIFLYNCASNKSLLAFRAVQIWACTPRCTTAVRDSILVVWYQCLTRQWIVYCHTSRMACG